MHSGTVKNILNIQTTNDPLSLILRVNGILNSFDTNAPVSKAQALSRDKQIARLVMRLFNSTPLQHSLVAKISLKAALAGSINQPVVRSSIRQLMGMVEQNLYGYYPGGTVRQLVYGKTVVLDLDTGHTITPIIRAAFPEFMAKMTCPQ